jgi:hypothetical protein
MARAPRNTQTVLDPGEHFVGNSGAQLPAVNDSSAFIQPDPYEDEPSPADRIAAMMGEIRGDDRAKVKVYKVQEGVQSWCDDYTPEQYESGGLPMLRRKWGAGQFRVMLYGMKVTEKGNYFGVRAREDITITESGDYSEQRAAPAIDTAAILTAMQENNRQMIEAMREARPDPGAQLRDTLALMTSMREAMGISPNGGGAAPSISSVLSDLRTMQKAAKEFGAVPDDKKDDEGGVIGQLVERIAPMVLGALNRQQGASNAAVTVPSVSLPPSLAVGPLVAPAADDVAGVAADGSAPGGAPSPVNTNESEDDLSLMYTGLMLYYNGLAKSGHDPEDAADQLYQQLPDDGLQMLKLDGWWEVFIGFSPRSAPYREWFTKVREQILKIDAEESAKGP